MAAATTPSHLPASGSTTDRVNGLLSRYSDLLLAGGVVLIIAMLVIRIPPAVMDYLLALNISVSVMVLLVALYIPDATKLPSFPTILLLTTLFRLALNVCSTRLILLEAYAGEVISAFGNFVVQGNYVVGGVVFVVLVLVQFIVVAKGSERVAEVSARFTLDAMPGKQMSIDADLRNGMITPEDARARRGALENESKLYGAMDGAMKFVKGDAIAGIIISLINVLGGMIIGVLQQGMSAGESAQIYSLLTIGDGLVSQIPALLICVSAGLVVTRVGGSEGGKGNLGRDMTEQLLGQPKPIAVVALLLIGIGLSSNWTGFPLLPFVALGGVAAILSVPMLLRGTPELAVAKAPGAAAPAAMPGAPAVPGAAPAAEEAPGGLPQRLFPLPIILELGKGVQQLFIGPDGREDPQARRVLDQGVRDHLTSQLGFAVPAVKLRVDSPHLIPSQYAIFVHECHVARGMFAPDRAMVMATPDVAAAQGLEVQPVFLPWGRVQVASIPAASADAARMAGLPVMNAIGVIRNHLLMTLRRHAADLLGIQETSALLDRLKQTNPDLIKATVPTHLNIQQVTEVLQRLLRELVSIRDLRGIVEALAKWGQTEKTPALLTELVRHDIRRFICAQFAVAQQRIEAYALSYDVAQLIQSSIQPTKQGPAVRMPPDDVQRVIQAVERAIDPLRHATRNAVVLTVQQLRRPLRSILEQDLPDVVVIAYEELCPEYDVVPLGTVTFTAPEPVNGQLEPAVS